MFIIYITNLRTNSVLLSPPDSKTTHPAWLRIKIANKWWFLQEDSDNMVLTDDPNKATIYRYHRANSPLLTNLRIQSTTDSSFLESENNVFELRYMASYTVQPILVYNKTSGLITRYLHNHNSDLIVNSDPDNLIEMDLPDYWHQ